MLPQLGGVEPGVGHHRREVGSVGIKRPLLGVQVDGLYLEELDNVVEAGEDDDGEDVAEAIPHLALLEREADCDEPLHSNSNHLGNSLQYIWKLTVFVWLKSSFPEKSFSLSLLLRSANVQCFLVPTHNKITFLECCYET